MNAAAASIEGIALDDREAWEHALAQVPHASAHTWDHCRAMAETSGLRTWLWVHRTPSGMACCPIAERECEGSTDLVTPLGFGGFTARGAVPGLAAAWRAWCESRGAVCAYIGLNPLCADPGWFAGDADADRTARAQTLYVLDLRQGEAALRAGLHASLRHKLRHAAPVEHSDEVGRDAMAAYFLARFADCFAGRAAGGAYRLTPATLERLAHSPHHFLLGVRGADGYDSVTLFGRTAIAGDAIFNVCGEAGRPHAFTLLWHGALQLMAEGVPFLNLGGGIREGDGVAQFKRRFGALERPLLALRQVFDPKRYAALCRAAGTDPASEGYFPAYRDPRPARAPVPGPRP